MAEIKKDILYHEIKDRIVSGKYEPGMRLPKEVDLAIELEVARGTLRPALQRLEEEELLRRVKGKGTFVSGQKQRLYLTVAEDIIALNRPPVHIARGIEARMREAGNSIYFCSTHDLRQLTIEDAIERFHGLNIQGIFLIESNFLGNEPEIALFQGLGLPVVLPQAQSWDREIMPTFAFCHPRWDVSFTAGLRYLAAQGHRRVAIISDHVDYPKGCLEIAFSEYKSLYDASGLEYRPEYITHVSENPSSQRKIDISTTVTALLKSSAPPTAFYCISDAHADAVYSTVKELNLRIPEDISVLGYYGLPGGVFMSPPLTTVDLGLESRGRLAASIMLRAGEWFEPGGRAPVVYPDYKILKRGSVAPR